MPPRIRIFLDMDGVIADFVGGIERLYGMESGSLSEIFMANPGMYQISDAIGIGRNQLAEKIRSTPGFWEGLEGYPWTGELIGLMASNSYYYDIFILTSPMEEDVLSMSSKKCWLDAYVKPIIKKVSYIFASDKYVASKPGSILIDDSEDNVIKFRDAGGSAIIFPQPWNSMRWITDRMHYMRQMLAMSIDTELRKSTTYDMYAMKEISDPVMRNKSVVGIFR